MINIDSINFPVICFNKYSFYIVENLDKLTTSTKAGLKNKLYTDLTIIDSSGIHHKVKNAEKLFGLGFLWGYNVFLNQKIKVKLNFSESVSNISLQEVKKMIIQYFQKDIFFWKSRGNFQQIKERVESAESISELINNLGKIINIEYGS